MHDRTDSISGQTVPEIKSYKPQPLMNTTAFNGQVFSMRN